MLLPCALLICFLYPLSFTVLLLVHNFLGQGMYFNDNDIQGIAQTDFDILLNTFSLSIISINNNNNQTKTHHFEIWSIFHWYWAKQKKKIVSTDLKEQRDICVGVILDYT